MTEDLVQTGNHPFKDIGHHAYEGNWPYEPCKACGHSGLHGSHITSIAKEGG